MGSIDAKDDGKKKKNKKQQLLPSLDDTNVWPDPSASAEKDSKPEPVAAAPISKKDKGKWTQVTPNITHSTPAPGQKTHDSRRRKNSTPDHSANSTSTKPDSTTPTHGRRASVPSMFDEEPSQSQRSHTRNHSSRGRKCLHDISKIGLRELNCGWDLSGGPTSLTSSYFFPSNSD